MADRLKLDTAALHDAGASLRLVAQEFSNANANSDSVADAIGHPGLVQCVADFAHGWDDKRAKMVESIAGLAESCVGISDGFEKLDRDFASAIRGES